MKLRDVSWIPTRAPRAPSAKFHPPRRERERGNNFQRVLEEGGICPPTRRRALNGFLVGAVKRIKTRTDDEGGGPYLPKIRLCIKTLSSPRSPDKFTAQWYLTLLARLMRNHKVSVLMAVLIASPPIAFLNEILM